MPATPIKANDADMILMKCRRETSSVSSLAPCGNSRCSQSLNSGVSASSSTLRQYWRRARLGGSSYCSSVTGGAALERFDFPVMHEFFAVHILQSRGLDGVRAPLPAKARDLVRRTDVRRRVAM